MSVKFPFTCFLYGHCEVIFGEHQYLETSDLERICNRLSPSGADTAVGSASRRSDILAKTLTLIVAFAGTRSFGVRESNDLRLRSGNRSRIAQFCGMDSMCGKNLLSSRSIRGTNIELSSTMRCHTIHIR